MNFYLNKIEINNFLSFFGKQEVKIKPFTAIICNFDEGKNDFFKAIEFVFGGLSYFPVQDLPDYTYLINPIYRRSLDETSHEICSVEVTLTTILEEKDLKLKRAVQDRRLKYYIDNKVVSILAYKEKLKSFNLLDKNLIFYKEYFVRSIWGPEEDLEEVITKILRVEYLFEEWKKSKRELERLQEVERKLKEKNYLHSKTSLEFVGKFAETFEDVSFLGKMNIETLLNQVEDMALEPVTPMELSSKSEPEKLLALELETDRKLDRISKIEEEENVLRETFQKFLKERNILVAKLNNDFKLLAKDPGSNYIVQTRITDLRTQAREEEENLAVINIKRLTSEEELEVILKNVEHEKLSLQEILNFKSRSLSLTSYGRFSDYIIYSSYYDLLKGILGDKIFYGNLLNTHMEARLFLKQLKENKYNYRETFIVLEDYSPDLKYLILCSNGNDLEFNDLEKLQIFLCKLKRYGLISSVPVLVDREFSGKVFEVDRNYDVVFVPDKIFVTSENIISKICKDEVVNEDEEMVKRFNDVTIAQEMKFDELKDLHFERLATLTELSELEKDLYCLKRKLKEKVRHIWPADEVFPDEIAPGPTEQDGEVTSEPTEAVGEAVGETPEPTEAVGEAAGETLSESREPADETPFEPIHGDEASALVQPPYINQFVSEIYYCKEFRHIFEEHDRLWEESEREAKSRWKEIYQEIKNSLPTVEKTPEQSSLEDSDAGLEEILNEIAEEKDVYLQEILQQIVEETLELQEASEQVVEESDAELQETPEQIVQESNAELQETPEQIVEGTDAELQENAEQIAEESDAELQEASEQIAEESDAERQETPEQIVEEMYAELQETPEQIVEGSDAERQEASEQIVEESNAELQETSEQIVEESDAERQETSEEIVEEMYAELQETSERTVEEIIAELQETSEQIEFLETDLKEIEKSLKSTTEKLREVQASSFKLRRMPRRTCLALAEPADLSSLYFDKELAKLKRLMSEADANEFHGSKEWKMSVAKSINETFKNLKTEIKKAKKTYEDITKSRKGKINSLIEHCNKYLTYTFQEILGNTIPFLDLDFHPTEDILLLVTSLNKRIANVVDFKILNSHVRFICILSLFMQIAMFEKTLLMIFDDIDEFFPSSNSRLESILDPDILYDIMPENAGYTVKRGFDLKMRTGEYLEHFIKKNIPRRPIRKAKKNTEYVNGPVQILFFSSGDFSYAAKHKLVISRVILGDDFITKENCFYSSIKALPSSYQ